MGGKDGREKRSQPIRVDDREAHGLIRRDGNSSEKKKLENEAV
jgi:hypothetical protein